MSLFDKDLAKEHLDEQQLELRKNIVLGMDILMHRGALVVWENENDRINELINMHSDHKTHNVLCMTNSPVRVYKLRPSENDLTVPLILKKQEGRPFVELDCKTLGKGHADSFLYHLSKCSPNPDKPMIVLISNITDIPSGANCDDPAYVENLLLHSWKERICHHTHILGNFGINSREEHTVFGINSPDFEINSWDFTIIIPIQRDKATNINSTRLRNDGLAQIQFDELVRKTGVEDKDYLLKNGYISEVQSYLLKNPVM